MPSGGIILSAVECVTVLNIIWSRFCISMTDYERPILAAEEKFFNECNTGNGKQQYYQWMSLWLWYDCWGVPCIALLTKADTLKYPAFSQLKKEGLTPGEAMLKYKDTALQILKKVKERIEINLSKCKYPPKAYLSLACKLSRQLGIIYSGWLNISMELWTNMVLIVRCSWGAQQTPLMQWSCKGCWYQLSK